MIRVIGNVSKKGVTHNAGGNKLYSAYIGSDEVYSPVERLINNNGSVEMATKKIVKGNIYMSTFVSETYISILVCFCRYKEII